MGLYLYNDMYIRKLNAVDIAKYYIINMINIINIPKCIKLLKFNT